MRTGPMLVSTERGKHMTTVVTVSPEELITRRAELLEAVGASLDDIVRRAQLGQLRDAEWAVWTEICELQYLLGVDPSSLL